MAVATIKKFGLAKKDLGKPYPVTIKDSDGVVVDITSAAIVCTMKLVGGTTPKINRQSAGITITDGPNGEFEYQWQAGETDTVGLYDIEFEVTPSGGQKLTYPDQATQSKAQVEIYESLDST